MANHRIETLAELRALIGEPHPLTPAKVSRELDGAERSFIARSPFLVLSTSDREGRQDVSPKGDPPGFVLVEDARTLVIPDRKGNKLLYGLQNLLENPRVGVLFLVPGTGETLRVNGRAELTTDPAILERLSARAAPALLAIRVHVEECFFHCAKAFLRAELWKPGTWPERQRISFGRQIVERTGGDAKLAPLIDASVEQDYEKGL
jgi:PPOX class probable FMN-dependent enzyme